MNQMHHAGSAKPHKPEGRAGSGSLIGQHQAAKLKSGAATSSGNRYAGSSSGPGRGVTPTTDANKIMFSQPTQFRDGNRSEMYVQQRGSGSNDMNQYQQQHMSGKQTLKDYDRQPKNASHSQSINSLNSQFSAANLPQASSIVTGGKMLGGSSQGNGTSGTRGSQYLQSSHSTHGLQGPSRKK